jgi:competence protein ComFC
MNLGKILLAYFFPGACLVCGSALGFKHKSDYPVCGECVSLLDPIGGNRCVKCGCRLISERNICTRCRETDYSFDSHISMFEYTGPIKELIYQYKFEGRQSLSNLLANLLGSVLEERFPGLPVIPVPSSKKSLKKRGWHHIGLVVKKLHQRFGIRYFEVLSKTTDIPQKELSYEDRLENLKGRIVCEKSRMPRDLATAILIDDVFTTGATAGECARVLRAAGVKTVHVLTIAID